ncbi:MAG: METTL5 family protein [Candidatus Woesearchaeota archaeon]
MVSRKSIAVELSRLKSLDSHKLELEQYETGSEIASILLWHAYMRGDISNKTVADLGAGNGILGIGALMLGAKHVTFLEKDIDAVNIMSKNLSEYEEDCYNVMHSDISKYNSIVDTVIMNPPFGAQIRHADAPFINAALSYANKSYIIIPPVSLDYYKKAVGETHSLTVLDTLKYRMPKHYDHQKKITAIIEVMIIVINKQS